MIWRGRAGRFAFLLGLVMFHAALPGQHLQAQEQGDSSGPLTAGQGSGDTSRPPAITNSTIVKMTKAGLDEAIILQSIRLQPGKYNVAPDDLIALKAAGVSETVIAAMQARAAGLAVHDPQSDVPIAPISPSLDDIGVYYKDKNGEWQEMKTERVSFKSSGWLKNAVTDGLVKQDMNGHVDGGHSSLALNGGTEVLIYTPRGTAPEEYDLLRLEEHSKSREFRTLTGGLFHSQSGAQRDELEWAPKKIAAQMYVWTIPADIVAGEYGVLPPGAANTQGLAGTGKIFTFSIGK